jgi:D-serine deaminase-like pyridoxal phosphate-dependent protein
MFDDIETPALLLDGDKLERNCRRMRERVQSHGVMLRPHVKTAKSLEVARMALDAPTGPITVSTLREAEYFFDHGFRDILYAVGIVPGKVARLAELIGKGARMSAIVDSAEAARVLGQASAKAGVRIPTLIEIDSDGHRAGVAPGEARLFEVAEALGESLLGVMTHAGDSYNCKSTEAIRAIAAREREAVVASAAALRARGHASPVVSVGSTPTATFAESFAGVTEVRTGVYVFQDLVMAGLGVCAIDDIAISVLGSVIGHQRDKNWILTDAGWMALSRDRGTAAQRVDQGYGVVCDASGRPIEGLIVAEANQEHGIIARRDGGPIDFARFPIGSLVRIFPNHACATAAQHAQYKVLRKDHPMQTWDRFGGW